MQSCNVWRHSFFGLCLASVLGMKLNTRRFGVIGFCPQVKQRVKHLISWTMSFIIPSHVRPNSVEVLFTLFVWQKGHVLCPQYVFVLRREWAVDKQWMTSKFYMFECWGIFTCRCHFAGKDSYSHEIRIGNIF